MVKYIDDGVLLSAVFFVPSPQQQPSLQKYQPRSNARLNEAIEQHIAQWDGTVHGFCIKNMWENGADYESICEAANIDIEDYEDD